jgi:hypothetical protein
MAATTRAELIAQTREYMDAVGSDRWSDNVILLVLDQVFDAEWSNILNAAPYYTFGERQVSTDGQGRISFASLNAGGGDAQENFYRLISLSDGNRLFQLTRFQDVPLAKTSNFQPTNSLLYYPVGKHFQVLPVSPGLPMIAFVNHKPTGLRDLLADGSVIDFPESSHLIVVYEAAANLLMKGGAESRQAADLKALAREERASLLDDIRRRTIQPTELAYPDDKWQWGGG